MLTIILIFFSPEVNRRNFPAELLQKPHRVLVVLAHADDEVMSAGLLATLVRTGSTVRIVTLTDGAANPASNLSACEESDIVACRARELRESIENIGTNNVALPQFPDSKLTDFTDSAVRFVAQEIVHFRPTLIQSVEPSGLNGNADHIAASRIATLAAAQVDLPNLKLILTTLPFPISIFLRSGVRAKVPFPIFHFALSNELVELKARSARAHKSQTTTLSGLSAFLGPQTLFRWVGRESFYIFEQGDLTLLNGLHLETAQ